MANKVYPLIKSSDFRKTALGGRRRKLSSWLTIQTIQSDDEKNYFGVTISGKVANAVVRNKLKRWVRACVRKEPWPEKYEKHKVVFVFRPHSNDEFFKRLSFSEFFEVFRSFQG